MILCLLLWNLLSIKDICFYQQNRYQKDRYMMNLHLNYQYVFLWIILCILIFVLIQMDQLLLFYLFVLMIGPYFYKMNQKYMKQLVITKRIMRLLFLMLCFDGLLYGISCIKWLGFPLVLTALIFHSFTFMIFIFILHPIEMKIRQQYVNKAKKKLAHFKGIRIGITGSYGKTSIKNLIYDVCSLAYSCLKTKASYNNEMGITKTILEEMKNQDIFICEMGADHLHEIEDLCNFVHPTIGIVSSIGPQHLSTFKTMQNIFHEKTQLLESLSNTGIGFYNFDNHYLHEMDYTKFKCPCVQVGIHSSCKLSAFHIQVDHLGSQFDVMLDEKEVHFTTNLLGEHNILNCLFAIGVGHYLHIDSSLIQLAIASAKPVEHRLELKPFYKGMCIDNAYNSNPESAKWAVEVLLQMPGKHYIVTPGFIDLGEHHSFYSQEFGKQIAMCDEIILVGKCESIEEGIKSIKENPVIIHQKTMKDALIYMKQVIQEKETFLIENDIPEGLINT